MKNHTIEMSISLTEEDQLALLKDSIDLRFTRAIDNEFAHFKKANALKQFKQYPNKSYSMLPEVNDLDQDLLQEQQKTMRNLRYLCSAIICLALLAPFLNLADTGRSLSGVELISMVVGLYNRPVGNVSPILFVTAYPILLAIYAVLIAFLPKRLSAEKVEKIRGRLWNLTAAGGILYFFTALILFSMVVDNIYNGSSAIGSGYYLSMTAIFTYHFLSRFTERTTEVLQSNSTAKL